MNFYEYQTKTLFQDYGIPTPQGKVVRSTAEISEAISSLGGTPVVVKAQVLAGGRGKAGGIKFANTPDEAEKATNELLGKELRTHQTGEHGETIRSVYFESKSSIAKQYYLGMVVDREQQKIVFIASSEGGVEIEEVAAKTPEKIHTIAVPLTGYSGYVGRKIGNKLGFNSKQLNSFSSVCDKLTKLFIDVDASLLEINPLVLTEDDKIIALDGKFGMDSNATYRQKRLVEMYQGENIESENPQERKAHEIGVNYVALDGNIGCMVNGAGLAMATMDVIKLFGGEPANFLDVGGGASTEQVRDAFKLLTSHDKVQGILVNIFGGIVHCDKVANGIVQAVKDLGLSVPVVVRLEGTRVEEARTVLKESGLDLTPASDLETAAKLIVEKVGK